MTTMTAEDGRAVVIGSVPVATENDPDNANDPRRPTISNCRSCHLCEVGGIVPGRGL